MSELATQFDFHPNQIKPWKNQLLDDVTDVLHDKPKVSKAPEINVKSLHAKIDQLALENDLLEEALDRAGLLPSARNDGSITQVEPRASGQSARDQPGQSVL